jgi:hypothetical protein
VLVPHTAEIVVGATVATVVMSDDAVPLRVSVIAPRASVAPLFYCATATLYRWAAAPLLKRREANLEVHAYSFDIRKYCRCSTPSGSKSGFYFTQNRGVLSPAQEFAFRPSAASVCFGLCLSSYLVHIIVTTRDGSTTRCC